MKKAVHDHSLEAYDALRANTGGLSRRCGEILDALRRFGRPATDRAVMQMLSMPDMNCVRPRITELVKAGALAEAGEVICPVTGKRVRLIGFPARKPIQAEIPYGQRLTTAA